MKVLNNQYYVEVNDQRNIIHPTEKIIIKIRDPPKSFRTQYQVQINTQLRKNQSY